MRASGILLHPSSLPGPGPIGTLGRAAFGFVDWLAEAGQKIWQVLPLGPTGFGSSPYMATSAMAGNALLIDAEWFTLRRWLLEVPPAPAHDPATVDFAAAMAYQRGVIEAALAGFDARGTDAERAQFAEFCASRAWLPDFALFTALAEKWPDLIDVNAGTIATGEQTIEQVGQQMFEFVLDVASGKKKTWAEHWRLHNALAPFNPGPVT